MEYHCDAQKTLGNVFSTVTKNTQGYIDELLWDRLYVLNPHFIPYNCK